MAGPADYLRVSGPLGGANFLSVQDYNAIDPMSTAKDTIGLFQSGTNLAGSMMNLKAARDGQAQAQKDTAARQEAMKYGTTLPSYQPATAPQSTVAAPSAMPTQQEVPVAAAVPSASLSAQPAPITAVPQAIPSQQLSQPPVSTSAPTTIVQEAAGSPTPVTPTPAATPRPAAPAVATMPPTAAAPTAPAVGGRVGALLEGVQKRTSMFDADKQALLKDLQAGKISPAAAEMVLAGITSSRDKDIGGAVKFEETLAKIGKEWADSDKTSSDAAETRTKVAKATRDFEDDKHFEVLSLAKADPQFAAAQAAKYGMDPTKLFKADGTPTAELETRAMRSPTAMAAKKEAREQAKGDQEAAKADREAAGVGSGKDVPAGVREVMVRGADGQPTVGYVNADGKRLTQAEVTAMSLAGKRAGATNVSTGGSGGDRGSSEPGSLRGITVDKQGNITLSKDVQTNLAKTRPAAEAAANAKPIMDQLRAAVSTGAGSESRTGSALATAGEFLPEGMKPEITKVNQQITNASNALLGLLSDPRMKGNPTATEARAVMKIIADPTISNEVKMERINTLTARFEADIADHNTAVSQYDQPTQRRLKATGLDTVGDRGPKPEAGKPSAPAAPAIPQGWSVKIVGGK